jgi:hypothetical protein
MDIVQANGMVDNRLDRSGPGCPDYWYVNHKLMQSGPEMHSYADMWGDLRGRCIYPNEARRVYLNRGAGAKPQFVDVAGVVGLTRRDNSRGVALVDLDNDGRLDVVIANQHGAPSLLRNVPSPATLPASWIGLRLQGDGKRCNREALGSTVSVHVPGRPVQIREVQAANGFSAQHDTRVHFGLGSAGLGSAGLGSAGLGSAGLGSGVHQPIPVSVHWCGRETVQYHLAPGRYHHMQR